MTFSPFEAVWFHSITQVGLVFLVLLPQPLDDRCGPPVISLFNLLALAFCLLKLTSLGKSYTNVGFETGVQASSF